MKSVDFIHSFGIFSHEGKTQPASKSEVRRWIESKAVLVNGEVLEIEEMNFPLVSVVLFSKGNRVTLF
jgi:hypothetical protein